MAALKESFVAAHEVLQMCLKQLVQCFTAYTLTRNIIKDEYSDVKRYSLIYEIWLKGV